MTVFVTFQQNKNFDKGASMLDLSLVGWVVVALSASGAVIGIFFLKRIPQKAFIAVVQILAAAAAVELLF